MDGSKYSEYGGVSYHMEDFEWAMKLSRVSLQLLGLWPKAEKNFREKLINFLHVFVILLILVFGTLIPYTLSLITVRTDIMLMIQNLQYVSAIVSCIVRLIIFWWKKEAVKLIVNMIASDWQNAQNTDDRNVMIKWAQRSRTFIIIIDSIMGMACICINILPVFGIQVRLISNITISDKPLPLQSYDFYDTTKSPLYELTYIIQILSIVSACVTFSGIDTFLGLLVFHICGQLDILGTRIMELDRLMRFHDHMKSCVVNHIRLLRAIDTIEDIYNIMLLVIFLDFILLLAAYGFLIVIMIEEIDDVSKVHLIYSVCNVINILSHISLYCAVGETLVTKCERLHYAVYNQKWYLLKSKAAKGLILLMIRSDDPHHIIAGKMFPLSMVTFCSLIKTSAGYISVLLATRKY